MSTENRGRREHHRERRSLGEKFQQWRQQRREWIAGMTRGQRIRHRLLQAAVVLAIAIIAVCAACTFLERWLPWLLFGHRAVPKVVEYLGKILPMAVMVSLLVYCLRGMQFTAAGAWVPQVIAVGVTAGLHWWRRNTLLSIAAGTVCYMLLVQLVF